MAVPDDRLQIMRKRDRGEGKASCSLTREGTSTVAPGFLQKSFHTDDRGFSGGLQEKATEIDLNGVVR